ncbi:magnesium-dependent phosphatase-1 [uncultured Draconibacterium sp.]|uniref:magnesium-dependent phosphatase-1 n=1 Tax=uncultured Draconibacterium sp. TaxID=1573823 RepID=UPI003216D95E
MRIFVFDLDFTIWDAGGTWCDATSPPYKWENGKLLDQKGGWIRLYEEVVEILDVLKSQNKFIVAASRTYRPIWAQELLQLLDIDKYFDLKEIYPSSKIHHFNQIENHFKMLFSEMVFFDDEYRNVREVSALGVNSVLVSKGITLSMVKEYL